MTSGSYDSFQLKKNRSELFYKFSADSQSQIDTKWFRSFLPSHVLKDKSRVDKIIVKKQPYQLLNTSRGFFPSFCGLNFHKFDD